MYNIARKNTLGIHLRKFRKEFGSQYNFFPHTWLYPADLHELQEYNAKKMRKRQDEVAQGLMTPEQSAQDSPCLYIVKPEAGCQGRGIFIVKGVEELQKRVDQTFKKQATAMQEQLRIEENQETAQRYGKTDTETKERTVLDDLQAEVPTSKSHNNTYVI